MYYSSESSDSENTMGTTSLDFSYLLMDSESIGVHLRNSVQEQRNNSNLAFASGASSSIDTKELNIPEENNLSKEIIAYDKDGASSSNRSYENGVRKKYNYDQLNDNLSSKDIASNECYDERTEKLFLQHNVIMFVPYELTLFKNIKCLDLSNNNLTSVNEFLLELVHLENVFLRSNNLTDSSFPKDMSSLQKLRELNVSGNQLTAIPNQFFVIHSLKFLYLGGNRISEVSQEIKSLQNLQVLHLGGNELVEVPVELGSLQQLGVLALCDNQLRRLPRAISNLKRLKSLLLHKNNLCCLPVEIVKLGGLAELSIRDNPLVSKFVNCCAKELIYTPPSLMELAARVIKRKQIPIEEGDVPHTLKTYLDSGHHCVNPKCKGMYFTSCVEHIKFVDFCGMYRVPLMHYLCSSRCSSRTPAYYRSGVSESDSDDDTGLRKVLLG